MIPAGSRGMLSGFGSISADSVTATNNVSGARFLAGDGTAAAPSFAFTSDTDTGMHRDSANVVRIDAAGGYVANFGAGAMTIAGSLFVNSYVQFVGAMLNTSRTVNIDAAADTISTAAASSSVVRVTLSLGSIASTAAPFLADGVDGQEIHICRHSDAGDLTLSDEGTVAGSNMRLGAATRVLGPRDVIGLRYLSSVGDWVEFAYANIT